MVPVADDAVQLCCVSPKYGLGGEPGENTMVSGTPHNQARQWWVG